MILIHGFAASKDIGVIPLLFERIAQLSSVISFDLPAHGETPGAFEELDMVLLDRAVDSIIDVHAGDRGVVLVGHSLGGVLAYRAAARRRDVSGIVLLAPGFQVRSRFLLDLEARAFRDGTATFTERGREYRVSKRFFGSREFDPLPIAQHVPQPTLVVVGDLDYTVDPKVCESIAHALVGGSFVLARGEGHDLKGLSYWDRVGSLLADASEGRGI